MNGALDDDIAGTRSVITTGLASMTVDGVGGAGFFGGLLGGSIIDIKYVFDTAFNMNALGDVNRMFGVDLFDTVTGSWSLEAFFTNTAALQSSLGLVGVSTPGARIFDYSLLPSAVATDVKEIQLRLRRLTDGSQITSTGSLVYATASPAAVPEPTSLALFITGLSCCFAASRWGKKTQTVV